MAFVVSRHVEDALWRAAARVLPDHALGGRSLERAIVERSRRYTSEREAAGWLAPAPSARESAADSAAHALFFAVTDAAKIGVPLAELEARGLIAPERPEIRVLDLGSGPGAMSLGLIDYLHRAGALAERPIAIHAVDRDQPALDIMRHAVADLAEKLGARVSLTTECADIVRWRSSGAPYDLVLAGSLFNELDPGAHLDAATRMLAHTAARGASIIIEPALRDTARALQELRDALIAAQAAHVFAPCTRTKAPCPLLDDPDDWCHEDRRTDLTPRAARLSSITGLRRHGLKFAYLTLRHDAASQAEGQVEGPASGERVALRIVSQPERSKGKRECLVCGDRGAVKLRLLRKNRGPAERDFERTRRGDVVLVPARLLGGGDIERADAVSVASVDGHRPAGPETEP